MAEAIRLSKASAKRERRKMTQRVRSQGNTPEEDPADAAALTQALAASRVEAANLTEREWRAKMASDEEEEAIAMAIARSLQARSPGKNNHEDDAALALAIARSLQEAEDRALARERDETCTTKLSAESFQFAEEARRMAEEAWSLEEQHTQKGMEGKGALPGAADASRAGGSPHDDEMAMAQAIAASIEEFEGGVVDSRHNVSSPQPEPEPESEPEINQGRSVEPTKANGFSATSPWARFVCDTRAYYWHMETEQLSLAPPAEGVLDDVPLSKAKFDPVYEDAVAQASGASISTASAAVMLDPVVQHGAAQACEHAQLNSFLAAQLKSFLAAQLSLAAQAKLEEQLLAHGITDIQAFARLTEGNLKAMGVAKGPRVKLLRTVGKWLPDATVPSETGPKPYNSSVCYAANSSAQQQGVDLAAALFTQAEELAAGVAAPLTQPSNKLNTVATVMAGDKSQPMRTATLVQPSTLQARMAGNEQVVSDADVGKMVELGFHAELSRQALLACGGELRSALEWALASGI
jgi:hypothetical protein